MRGGGREIEVMGNKCDQDIQILLKTLKDPWEMFTNWKEYIGGRLKAEWIRSICLLFYFE